MEQAGLRREVSGGAGVRAVLEAGVLGTADDDAEEVSVSEGEDEGEM